MITIPPEPLGFKRDKNLMYCDLHSATLGGRIRMGWELDIDDEDKFAPLILLVEVWIGPCDLSIHLDTTTSSLLQYELRRYIDACPGVLV